MKLVFSQVSIFNLYRLGLIVTGKTGKKYRLSNEKEMRSLICYCNRSEDTSICRQYDAFLYTLEPEILRTVENITGRQFQETKLRRVG
ncbi:MAG: hypothetical protein V3T17_09730 [Pseudomonadales bacterium]